MDAYIAFRFYILKYDSEPNMYVGDLFLANRPNTEHFFFPGGNKKQSKFIFIPRIYSIEFLLFNVICLTYISLQGFQSTSGTILSNISINIRKNLLYLKIFTDTGLNFYLLLYSFTENLPGVDEKSFSIK